MAKDVLQWRSTIELDVGVDCESSPKFSSVCVIPSYLKCVDRISETKYSQQFARKIYSIVFACIRLFEKRLTIWRKEEPIIGWSKRIFVEFSAEKQMIIDRLSMFQCLSIMSMCHWHQCFQGQFAFPKRFIFLKGVFEFSQRTEKNDVLFGILVWFLADFFDGELFQMEMFEEYFHYLEESSNPPMNVCLDESKYRCDFEGWEQITLICCCWLSNRCIRQNCFTYWEI